ncbi:MAG: hypothetical protein CMJ18_02640 [Phycisphaeraceae bacterium]|nr:hypothetical protein [Phycisphaeraceae bacterium]
MSQSRRVLTTDGAGRIRVIDEPCPVSAAGEVLVEVAASIVSPGTELGGVAGRRAAPRDDGPAPFGYSNAGVILALGDGVTTRDVGQRVACMGKGALHATHAVVPVNLTAPIPDGVSDADASAVHLLATALHAARRLEPEIGHYVAVAGLGIVGNFSAQCARLGGCHVVGMDGLPLRREIAGRCGLDLCVDPQDGGCAEQIGDLTRGHGLDGAVIAFAGEATETLERLMSMMKHAPDGHAMGRVAIVGGATIDHAFAAALGNLDLLSVARTGPGYHDAAWEQGGDYPPVIVPWTTGRNMEQCLDFIANKRLLVEPLITHRVSLSDAPDACDLLISSPNEALGVVILPGE